jgi:hypothetical protein
LKKEQAELAVKNGVVIAAILTITSLFSLLNTVLPLAGAGSFDFLVYCKIAGIAVFAIILVVFALALRKYWIFAGVVLVLVACLDLLYFSFTTSIPLLVLGIVPKVFFIYVFYQSTKGCIALRRVD